VRRHPLVVPIDYALAASTVRIKAATSPGTFADDPDVTDPTVELPEGFQSDDPDVRLAWRLPYRATSQVKLKVTFRDANGIEVAGTFTARGFVVVPLAASEAPGTRPSVEDHGEVDGVSATHMIFDELSVHDNFGIVFTAITAPNATRMFVRAEEID
jgi:hypothetical protein